MVRLKMTTSIGIGEHFQIEPSASAYAFVFFGIGTIPKTFLTTNIMTILFSKRFKVIRYCLHVGFLYAKEFFTRSIPRSTTIRRGMIGNFSERMIKPTLTVNVPYARTAYFVFAHTVTPHAAVRRKRFQSRHTRTHCIYRFQRSAHTHKP